MDERRALIKEIYKSWQSQDVERSTSLLAEDMTYDIIVPPEILPLGGKTTGRAATVERLQEIVRQFEFLIFRVEDLMVDGDRACAQVRIHYRHRETGAEIETTTAHLWRFGDGKIVELLEYHDVARIQDFVERVARAAS